MAAAAGAEAFAGVSVQPMAAPGTEVIMGMTQDPQFGPVLMFGLGGVLVEVLKDVAFRVVPLAPHDARRDDPRDPGASRCSRATAGRRRPTSRRWSRSCCRCPSSREAHPEVQELDLNPILARHDGATAVDARIVLTPA